MRTLAILLVTLLVFAGAAAAQVAAPSLNPVLVFNKAPGNAAVLSWDMPSRLGVAGGTAKFKAANGASIGDGNFKAAQAQYVGERFALGAQDIHQQASGPGVGSLTQDLSEINAAVQFGSWISLGVGQEGNTMDNGPGSKNTETLPHFGATVRLAEVLYLGADGGTATIQKSGIPQGTRPVKRYGVAYLYRNKTDGLHAEIFHEQRDASSSTFTDKEDTNGGTIEFKISGIALGYTNRNTDLTTPAGATDGTQKLKVYSLSWVPEHGLSVGLSYTDFKATLSGGPPRIKITALGVSWLY